MRLFAPEPWDWIEQRILDDWGTGYLSLEEAEIKHLAAPVLKAFAWAACKQIA